ncbi:MAG: hypothetical protein VB913_12330, partial [Rhodospirillales bacterium]
LARLTEDYLLEDRKAPRLKVFHVKNGRLHAFSSPVTIRGIAEDANGIVSLKINGKPVRMRSRVFSKKLHVPHGEHMTLVEAEDAAGNIAYFQFRQIHQGSPNLKICQVTKSLQWMQRQRPKNSDCRSASPD